MTGRVEEAEALLGAFIVDEEAAIAAVSHAKGDIAIARLSMRKARETVDKAEAKERWDFWVCGACFRGAVETLRHHT